jgi:hypothetical protein
MYKVLREMEACSEELRKRELGRVRESEQVLRVCLLM